MNQKMGKHIANTVGTFITCEIHEDGFGWGTVLPVLIELDLHKPIARGRTINVQGNRLWIPFIYEKLPRLYFKCRRNSHGLNHCTGGENTTNRNCGPWLRAIGIYRSSQNRTHTGVMPSYLGTNRDSSESGGTSKPVSPAGSGQEIATGGKLVSPLNTSGKTNTTFLDTASVDPIRVMPDTQREENLETDTRVRVFY